MEILENFVVLEGLDGSGTTTQLKMLQDRYEHPGTDLPPLWTTFEPTQGPLGHLLRSALQGNQPFSPLTLAYLFAADRSEHLYGEGGILERCRGGSLVVSDRYVLSSLVYQGIDLGEEIPVALNAPFPLPELLFYLDIDPETAQKRLEGRSVREIYEYADFQREVYRRYQAWLPRFASQGVRIVRLDASLPPEDLGAQVRDEICKKFKPEPHS